MKVRCEVEAVVKLQQAFYIDVDDPTDDEKSTMFCIRHGRIGCTR